MAICSTPCLQDLRYAFRALRSSPGFASVAILSLALGIGANTAIFSLIDSVILKTLPVSHPEQLLQVTMAKDGRSYTNPIWEQVRDRQDVFSGIFAYGGARFNLSAGGEARYATGKYVAGQFFETLGLHPMLGRTLTIADDKTRLSRRRRPQPRLLAEGIRRPPGILGKSISLDNHPFEITGVVEPGFTGVDVGNSIDVYVPLCTEKIIRGESSMLDYAQRLVAARRSAARSPAFPQARPRRASKRWPPSVFEATVPPNWKPDGQADYRKNTFATRPAANGLSYLRRQYQQALWILMAIIGAVLLIACANVANLLLARSAARQREIAIRMALGSGRARLMRQLLTESMVLSLTGAALGVLFAQWGTRLLVRFLSTSGNEVFLDLAIDGRVLGFTAGIAILTGLAFGLAPAWRGTRVNPQSAMKANARGVIEGSKFGLGKALVVLQVALSLVLVVGAGLMLTTFFKLETVDPDLSREHILLTSVDLRNGHYPKERRAAVYREMLEHLRAIPGVRLRQRLQHDAHQRQASGTKICRSTDTLSKGQRRHAGILQPGERRILRNHGQQLVAGRDFNSHDTLESPESRHHQPDCGQTIFRRAEPIGKRYRVGRRQQNERRRRNHRRREGRKIRHPARGILPTAFVAASQDANTRESVNFRTACRLPARPRRSISARQVRHRGGQSRRVTQFKSLAVQVDESLARERLLATLSGFFGALALLLAMIGLYGVMSYNVARRRNEIGIRMALGAEQSRVLRMVLKEVAILIGVGLAIGLGAAFGTTRFVESFLYGMKPNDPWTLTLAAAVLAAVAAIAGFLPARRASRLDPMTALRDE